jgi:hypothetical protein
VKKKLKLIQDQHKKKQHKVIKHQRPENKVKKEIKTVPMLALA